MEKEFLRPNLTGYSSTGRNWNRRSRPWVSDWFGRGVVADIFIVGGAAMALAYDATRVTRDVSQAKMTQTSAACSTTRACG